MEIQKIKLRPLLLMITFLILSFIYVFAFLKTKQLYVSDDLIFHLERMEETYLDFKGGHLFPYIATSNFSQTGQAINSFYPPFITCIYALIRLVFKSPILSLYILIFIEQFLGLWIAYYAGKKILKSNRTALIFAIVLRFSAYVCYDDFARMDIGEGWALVFLPLTFCGLYLIVIDNDYVLGSIDMTFGLLLQTYNHILLPVITIFVLLIFYLISLEIQKNKVKVLSSILVSGVIYIISCLCIYVPALHMAKTGIFTPNINYLSNYYLNFTSLLENSFSNTFQRNYLGIGLILVVTLFIGLMYFFRITYINKAFYVLGLFFTLLSTNLFPWQFFSKTPLSILQFPWRLLSFSIFFLSLFFAVLLNKHLSKKYLLLLVSLILILTLGSQSQFKTSQSNQYHVATTTNDYENPWGKFINSENYSKIISNTQRKAYKSRFNDYIPKKSLNSIQTVFNHTIKVGNKKEQPTKMKAGFQSETYVISNLQIPSRTRVQLPFLIYNIHDYELFVNGKKTTVDVNSSNSCAYFKINKNIRKLKAKIIFRTPTSFIISRVISFILFIILLILFSSQKQLKKIKVKGRLII